MINNTRELDGQDEKHSPLDFALWKKASPEHIMHWPSPWGEGFPGWHLECSTMGEKYLGETFDIHGGGLDLLFPHHECEIAQSVAAQGHDAVKYWVHNNMIICRQSITCLRRYNRVFLVFVLHLDRTELTVSLIHVINTLQFFFITDDVVIPV